MGLHEGIERLERLECLSAVSPAIITEECETHPGHRCLSSIAYPEITDHRCTSDGSLVLPPDSDVITLRWPENDEVER